MPSGNRSPAGSASHAGGHTRRVAAEQGDRPDLQPLIEELLELEEQERDISARRRNLHARIAIFPNDALEAREREISRERRELHRRIDDLRARLALLGWPPREA